MWLTLPWLFVAWLLSSVFAIRFDKSFDGSVVIQRHSVQMIEKRPEVSGVSIWWNPPPFSSNPDGPILGGSAKGVMHWDSRVSMDLALPILPGILFFLLIDSPRSVHEWLREFARRHDAKVEEMQRRQAS